MPTIVFSAETSCYLPRSWLLHAPPGDRLKCSDAINLRDNVDSRAASACPQGPIHHCRFVVTGLKRSSGRPAALQVPAGSVWPGAQTPGAQTPRAETPSGTAIGHHSPFADLEIRDATAEDPPFAQVIKPLPNRLVKLETRPSRKKRNAPARNAEHFQISRARIFHRAAAELTEHPLPHLPLSQRPLRIPVSLINSAENFQFSAPGVTRGFRDEENSAPLSDTGDNYSSNKRRPSKDTAVGRRTSLFLRGDPPSREQRGDVNR